MVLTILRVLPVTRIAFTALFLAAFLSAASTRSSAVQVHEHKKTVPVDRSRRSKAHSATTPHASAAPHKSSRHTSSPTSSKTSRPPHPVPKYSTRYPSSRRKPSLVRASTPVHSRSSRTRYHYTTYYAKNRVPENEVAAVPVARSTTADTATVESPASDPIADNTPTAQAAADKIAARETSTPANQLTASVVAPSTYTAIPNSKIMAMAPLRGSLESLVRQNEKTDADHLERIENDDDLHARIVQGVLVPVPASNGLVVNPALPEDRRYCRPWTAKFLSDLAHAHDLQFHHPFEVSSAVRTVEYQKKLMRTNHNAAAAEGDVVSPHLTGATIDIAKAGLTRHELYWMRDRLNTLQSQGKIDVEEEFKQSCFHITVYRSYTGDGPPHKPTHELVQPTDGDDDDSSSPAEAAAHGR
jgi:Family of unknown function (DUF5715)